LTSMLSVQESKPLLRKAGVLEDERDLELLVVDVLLLKHLGPKYLEWDSDALKEELTEDFGEVGPVTWEKIQAARLLHTSETFWTEREVFEKVAASIMGELPIFSYAQPPESEEIAVAISTAAKIAFHPYDNDVLAYIAAACLNDGVWYFEDPLDIATAALSDHDSRKNIERDFGGVAARLQEVSSYISDPESAIDVQVNHVLGVRTALSIHNAAVERQMAKIPSLLSEAQ